MAKRPPAIVGLQGQWTPGVVLMRRDAEPVNRSGSSLGKEAQIVNALLFIGSNID